LRLATGLPFRETQCGFKLYRRDVAKAIFGRPRSDGFGFDVEALFIARKLKLRVVEVPVCWNNVEGTKVGALSGARAFWDLGQVHWNNLLGRLPVERAGTSGWAGKSPCAPPPPKLVAVLSCRLRTSISLRRLRSPKHYSF
jgi:hypothetical protein